MDPPDRGPRQRADLLRRPDLGAGGGGQQPDPGARPAAARSRAAGLDYESARERSRVANESLALAQEELELSRDRFTNGVTSSIEVDNAQDSLVSAQADRIAAAADRERARFALWRATGQIRDLAAPPREAP